MKIVHFTFCLQTRQR